MEEYHDQISELYYGLVNDLYSDDAKAEVKPRIHWICREAEGKKVIDIGCSQGIVSILLAREGFEVSGVDIDSKAIEFANSERLKESPEVQQRLTFIRDNILDADLPSGGFHTAVMGEFLEHQVKPEKAIIRVYELLADEGRLIITVPFGTLVGSVDHKQVFYMVSLYRLLYRFFKINEIEIIWRHLCFLCVKRQTPLVDSPDSIELALIEKVEHQLENRLAKVTRERDTKKKEAAKFKAEAEKFKAEAAKFKAEAEKFKAEAAELKSARAEITRLQAKLAKEKRTVQTIRSSITFQLGSMLIQAVRKPGRNTILLPYRVFRLGIRAVRKKLSPPVSKIVGKKAYVLETVKYRIDEIKQETEGTSTYAAEPRRKDLKIAVIMDKFTYDCFKYEANLITFTPDNWEQVLSKHRPDLLFVESAWHGNDDTWTYQIINLGQKPDSKLPEVVAWCKTQNIPTAFWNKEDPGHYNDFLDAARLFDYVFTSDADCVERYKKDLGHNNMFCLPFAVQPRIHNPIGSGEKMRDIAFAGSWYEGETEYRKRRREQMANILAPALMYDVDIYDRYFSLNNDRYRFPEQYQPYIVGELPYEEMVYAYRIYGIFLNVNSVLQSPTMFPRRVLEILASGTYVLSGYSKGIENLIGSDIVKMPSSPEETRRCLEELLGNKELKDRLAHLGLRKVMKEHTYEQRLDYILDTMGISKTANASEKKGVSIITCTNKLIYMDNIFANYDRQQYEDKELIIVMGNDQLDLQEWEEEAKKRRNVRVYRVDEKLPMGACLNFGVDEARFEYIAKFDDDDYYAPAYLEDMVSAFDYSCADIVGKCARYVHFENGNVLAIKYPGREHKFTSDVSGSAMIIKREVFDKVRFDPQRGVGEDTQFLKDCVENGVIIYAADRFNFAYIRRSSLDLHSWRVSDEEVLGKTSQIVSYTNDYGTHVTC